ncbi:MAG: pilus assembly protein PilP [Gemmatimonadaceae bacterium]|nr:pilus assembly protein PilP [Gemmatimonadaceae bacterium]
MMRPLMLCSALVLAAQLAGAQTPAKPVSATVTRESAGTVSAPKAAPAKASMPTEITLQREVFAYSGSGRRDPYKSLMTSSEVRPLLSDLRLAVVALDPDGKNSIAVLRDTYSKQQYRVRVGQQLGRLRVTAIKPKAVQFTMEEFGFNRTETLFLSSDTTKVRNP